MAKYDYQAYFDTYGDVETYYKDAKKKGILGGQGEYAKKYNTDTTGWEKNWLKGMNKKYGRDAKDLGEYSKKEYTDYHYNTYGKKEGRLDNEGYKKKYKSYKQDGAEQQGSTGGNYKKDAKVDMDSFQGLLNRLERSKKRQVRQKSVEGRRDTYAAGLSSMMSNF
jgi:hypothetical protein